MPLHRSRCAMSAADSPVLAPPPKAPARPADPREIDISTPAGLQDGLSYVLCLDLGLEGNLDAEATKAAIGEFQHRSGLLVTMAPDLPTILALHKALLA